MTTTKETPEPSATTAQIQVIPKQYVSRWHTAGERDEALRTKQKRRRNAHRIALRRSHSKG
jgi:hypothetical protein